MANLKFSKIKVISSLPGRLRVNVKGLLRNERMVLSVRNNLTGHKGVLSIHASKNTGSVLVYYNTVDITEDKIIVLIEKAFTYSSNIVIPENMDREPLMKIIFDMLNPISFIRGKYSKSIYENEYKVSRNLLRTSIGVAGIILLFTSNISNVISTLILGYPGILFAVGSVSYYYASAKLKQDNIYLKDDNSLALLSNVVTMLLEDDIFLSRFNKHNVSVKHLNKYDIQKLIILGELDNPVRSDIETIINDIRILGVNPIFIIENRPSSIVDYISYFLGLKILDTDKLEKNRNYLIINDTKGTTTLITTDESIGNGSLYSCCDLIICLYKNNTLNILKADINLEYTNINKLPLLIELSYFSRELNVQTENAAIALNSVGILLATLDYLTPLYSIVFYGLNTLLMTLTLKLRFNSYKNFNKMCDINCNQLTDPNIMHKELCNGK